VKNGHFRRLRLVCVALSALCHLGPRRSGQPLELSTARREQENGEFAGLKE